MDFTSSIGSPTVLWTFRILLVIILAYSGYMMSVKDQKQSKFFFWFAVISFALIEGLRWMRGPDYSNYYDYFETGTTIAITNKATEPLFVLWIGLFNYLNLYPPIGFIIHSGLLIFSFALMMKNYNKAMSLALPLFFIILGSSAENIVRQYTATSFLMLAYYFYSCNKNYQVYICFLIAVLFHYSSLFVVLLFFLLQWKRIPFKYPIVYVALYLFLYATWDPSWLDGFSTWVQGASIIIGDVGSFQKYVDDSDFWMTSESSFSAIQGTAYSGTRIVFTTIKLVANSSIIYYGFRACKADAKLHVVFYFTFLALILLVMFGDILILFRFVLWLNWMLPFTVGLIWYKKDVFKFPAMKYVAFGAIFLHYVYYGFIYYIGSTPLTGCGFIWDK